MKKVEWTRETGTNNNNNNKQDPTCMVGVLTLKVKAPLENFLARSCCFSMIPASFMSLIRLTATQCERYAKGAYPCVWHGCGYVCGSGVAWGGWMGAWCVRVVNLDGVP